MATEGTPISPLVDNSPPRDHQVTVELTRDPFFAGLDVESARWFCSCGEKSAYDFLFPPTAEEQATAHRAVKSAGIEHAKAKGGAR